MIYLKRESWSFSSLAKRTPKDTNSKGIHIKARTAWHSSMDHKKVLTTYIQDCPSSWFKDPWYNLHCPSTEIRKGDWRDQTTANQQWCTKIWPRMGSRSYHWRRDKKREKGIPSEVEQISVRRINMGACQTLNQCTRIAPRVHCIPPRLGEATNKLKVMQPRWQTCHRTWASGNANYYSPLSLLYGDTAPCDMVKVETHHSVREKADTSIPNGPRILTP